MKIINVAIIGTGFIASAHIEAVRRLGYAHIVAVAGSNLEKAKEFATHHHIPKYFGDYKDLLTHCDEIDVVHNCTPNQLHHEVNVAVIQAGKHILSEKPLTINAKESSELLELLKGKNLVHGVNFNYRQYPLVQQTKRMIEKGELGPIHLVHGQYLQDWMQFDTDFNWRALSEIGGNLRTVGDIGSHWIDLMQHVLNQKVTEVFADLSTLYPVRKESLGSVETFTSTGTSPSDYRDVPIDTEDFATVLLRFENGTKGNLLVSQVSAGHKNGLVFEANGKLASASWRQEEPDTLWIGYRDKPNTVLTRDPSLLDKQASAFAHYPGGHGEAWADGMKNMMREFYQAIIDQTDVNKESVSFATFHDGHQMMCILDAIYESAKTNKWVKIKGEKI